LLPRCSGEILPQRISQVQGVIPVKCSRCGREISEMESHPHQGQTLCDDCYIDAISTEKTCDPWATYLSGKERQGAGQKGTEGLTAMEKEVYEFVRSQGRATREDVMAKFGLSEPDLGPQLNVLMHAELLKEHSEGGIMYLIPIPVSP